jgi:cytochrome c peroxidase
MRSLKLAVCFVFALGIAVFSLLRTEKVAGQIGSAVSAPTNLSASDNAYNSKVGLYWDTIRGATTYRIFRNTVNNSLTAADIGTTPANSFFDTGAVAGTTYFYWVRAENSSTTSDLSAVDQGTRSNTVSQGGLQPLAPPPVPAGNPITATKIYLGKTLFWDEQMSSTRTVSCGTCHHSANGGTDPRSAASGKLNPGPDGFLGTQDDILGSLGVPGNNVDGTYFSAAPYGLDAQVTGRKTVSYVNAGYSPLLFWDGRATGTFRDPITNIIILNNGGALESQVLGPPLSTAEMSHIGRDWNDVAARMAASKPLALSPAIPNPLATWIGGRSYPELFQEAFGTPDVTPVRIALAIATFERSLYSDRAPIDLDAQGIATLTAQEIRGRNIFNSGANNCAVCHAGNRFTDESFRYIGVRPETDDTGRMQVTGFPVDRGTFRVPSLRNLSLRGTFFHNGRFTTLEQVVAFYDRGGDFDGNNKPNLIHPLGLNPQQQADLVAFLRRPLTDPRVASESERFDRPTLYAESSRVPQVTGTGRVGAGGATPQIKAISPPLVGNPNFTMSVSGALGNASAVLVIDGADPGLGTSIPVSGSFARVTANTQSTGPGNGWASVSIPIPNNASIVGKTFFARWYVTDGAAASGFSVSQAVRFTVFGDATAVVRAKYVDFDGDGRTDISVFRPDNGTWYELRSSDNSFAVQQFGLSTDKIAPGDYDGDGRTDIAVYRNGLWYLSRSRDGLAVVQFGLPGDIVQAGDFDGDGKDDLAVYRPSEGTWYMQESRDGFVVVRFGLPTDKAVAADYDGDGKTDIAIYRDGQWWINNSSGSVAVTSFGLTGDKPVQGDYDGDGKADMAVWRASSGDWYRLKSSNGQVLVDNYGIATDVPTPGDYDGDGVNDLTVFRPAGGMWYNRNSSAAERNLNFGLNGDIPVPSAIVP